MSLDLIDRTALLKDVRSECPESDVCTKSSACIECIINRQPTVNSWILCSERLPDEDTTVIALIDGCQRESFYSGGDFIGSNFWRRASDVTHWMPMPELPEKNEDNKTS